MSTFKLGRRQSNTCGSAQSPPSRTGGDHRSGFPRFRGLVDTTVLGCAPGFVDWWIPPFGAAPPRSTGRYHRSGLVDTTVLGFWTGRHHRSSFAPSYAFLAPAGAQPLGFGGNY